VLVESEIGRNENTKIAREVRGTDRNIINTSLKHGITVTKMENKTFFDRDGQLPCFRPVADQINGVLEGRTINRENFDIISEESAST
jgi:hypothetical protein